MSRTRLSLKLNRFRAPSPGVPVQLIVTAPPDDVILCSNVRVEGVMVMKADCVSSAEPVNMRSAKTVEMIDGKDLHDGKWTKTVKTLDHKRPW